MKKENNKHDHKLSKILKATIFFLVMLAPCLAVTTTCLTTLWNETITMPYQEINDIPPYETNEVNSIDDLVVGHIYDFTISTNYSTSQITYFNASKIYNLNNRGNKVNLDAENTADSSISFIEVANYFRIVSNNLAINITINGKAEISNSVCQFVYNGYFNPDYISSVSIATWMPQGTYEIIEHESSDLNVFYYSVNQIDKQPLFNWTKNTMIYSAVNNMTNGLGETTNILSILITYWAIITSIYIIIDIVIELFIFLTHWANDRVI